MSNQEQKSKYPETERFQAWYEEQKTKGLRDVKFCPNNTEGATVESFFAEVNMAINAESVEAPHPL